MATNYNNDNKSDTGIKYGMIIGHDLMVHLVLIDSLKRHLLEWDNAIITKKYIGKFTGKTNLANHDM